MENLLTRLQNEAGFTREQARMAVGIFRDYLVENNDDPDLLEALKIKSKQTINKVKTTYEDLADKTGDWADRMEDKAEDWADQMEEKVDDAVKTTKKKVKKTVDKISDSLDD